MRRSPDHESVVTPAADTRRGDETGPGAGAVLIEAERLLTTWSRDPAVVVQSVVFPVFLLLVFRVVLGRTLDSMGTGESLPRTVALTVLGGVVFGSVGVAMAFGRERDSGLLGRLWTQPVPRSVLVAGRLLAEAVRVIVVTVVLVLAAIPLGFRPDQGFWALPGMAAVVVLFGVALAPALLALAVRTTGVAAIQLTGALSLLLMFFSTGYAPVDAYPELLEPIVRWQPMSTSADAIRGLVEGGAIAVPLAATVAWALVSAGIGGPILVYGIRRAVARR